MARTVPRPNGRGEWSGKQDAILMDRKRQSTQKTLDFPEAGRGETSRPYGQESKLTTAERAPASPGTVHSP